jgi:hypothetical protein
MDRARWAAVATSLWCAALAWVSYGLGRRVPLLSLVDLGFHELGHLVTYPLPWDVVTAAMGSTTQVAVPLGCALYFAFWRRDYVGAGVCTAWAGTSARDASVYVADAPYQRLELIGGEHDWAFILERHLSWAAPLSRAVAVFGALLLVAGFMVPWLAALSGWASRPSSGLRRTIAGVPPSDVR